MKTLHSLVAGLWPTRLILVRRTAFPLLCLGAGLALVQPCAGQSGIWTPTGSFFAMAKIAAPSQSRHLFFEDRVTYQRAIEEVYWRHRIWPKERPDPKPSLDAVMSQASIEQKVQDYLRDSELLEQEWQKPITPEQLQAEMERMAQHSKQPEVLRELFAALGNDPFLIAECLARPVLSERLVTSFAQEQPNDRLALSEVGANNQTLKVILPNTTYTLPTIADATTECPDAWASTSTINAPDGRNGHTAVWTGSEMIVWGGYDYSHNLFFNTGGRYHPSTDSWTTTSTTNAPDPRTFHTAVWTGSEMIVWGGTGGPIGSCIRFNTGGRYNPSSDSWTPTSTTNAPDPRNAHTAVWTGSEMIVWGGFACGPIYFNTGGRYNPSTNSWTATNTTNAPSSRDSHTTVWTGSEMIVWGGAGGDGFLKTGGRYNPSSDSWAATNTHTAPAAREFHTAVWTGSQMIIWGGTPDNFDEALHSGGMYNPGSDSWTATRTHAAPAAREFHTAIWTGSEMIVWGGNSGIYPHGLRYFNNGGKYNPSSDSWTATSTTNAPDARAGHKAVWTGNEMIVWGGAYVAGGVVVYLNTGGKYCAQADGDELTLVSAASRKKHGNAGTFDIDLPLTGTPGVECRQGALGTATSIVFTFSDTVNSVDSTSTSCGRVISTQASGSTVTVLLKDIQSSCDGSEVTVTLTRVNGDSGTLASAAVTFGQLAGDINGDGTVDGNDLQSVRMNSGAGLVTDANFRNDVSGDGKVNHADISLTKAARGNSLP